MDTLDTTDISDQKIPVATPETLEVREFAEYIGVSPLRAAVRRFLRDRRALFCLSLIVLIVVFSYVFPFFYRHMGPKILGGVTGTQTISPEQYHDPVWTELLQSDAPGTLLPLGPKSLEYPLGADTIGRDQLARIMYGVNISVEVALLVEIFDIGLGVTLGTLAGWYGGWLGTVLDRFTDIVFAFPGLLLIILMGAALGPIFDNIFRGAVFGRLLMLTLAIGLLAWPLMMRYVRGQTLQLKEQQFVEAAKTVGTSDIKIIWRHIIPNVMNIVVVAATLDILTTIVSEAGLSVLGVGIRPPASSLGLMIADALASLVTSPTELLWPVVVLVTLIISFSFVGDGVRDAFDPRTKD